MIEKIVKDYLQEKLNIETVLELPKDFKTPLLVIEKTGSGFSNGLDTATIAVQSYGKSLYDAAVLNTEVIKIMKRIADHESVITRCDKNSDYNFTDTSTKRYRYQAVFDIWHYEE